jgi:hypothetical protein
MKRHGFVVATATAMVNGNGKGNGSSPCSVKRKMHSFRFLNVG